MRRIVWLLAALLVTVALAGCSGDKDRGQYRDLDKPKSGDTKDK